MKDTGLENMVDHGNYGPRESENEKVFRKKKGSIFHLGAVIVFSHGFGPGLVCVSCVVTYLIKDVCTHH